jgi:hypothetical protein
LTLRGGPGASRAGKPTQRKLLSKGEVLAMHRWLKLAIVVAVGLSCFVLSCLPASAQVTLALKYTPGEKSTLTDRVSYDQTLTVLNQPQKTGVNMTFVIDVANGEPASDGSVSTSSTFRSIVHELRLPTSTVRFDSANPAGNTTEIPEVQVLFDVLSTLVNRTLTSRIDAEGRVTAVEGIKEIVRAAPEKAAKALERELSEADAKRDAQQEIDALPREAVAVGDAWTRTEVMSLGGGQALTFERHYEYAGEVEENGRKYDKITLRDEKAEYKAPPELPVKSSDLKVDASEGVLLFDRERGRVAIREMSTKISGPMVLNIMGMEVPSTLELAIETRRSVE